MDSPAAELPDLSERIGTAAFAFRGYNITNLGRSSELLAHPVYGPIVKQWLRDASQICGDVVGRRVNLVERVRHGRETSLENYDEAIALIVAMEMAQVRLLEEFHGVRYADGQLAFGYSLGELSAVACGGVFDMADGLRVPLAMARDSAELAQDVTMGVVFSRGPELPLDDIKRLCLRINAEGQGVIGISAVLSPNTVLVLGQGKTVARFKATMHDLLHPKVLLRPNPDRWPPMHTPIVWQRNVPNRSAVLLHTLHCEFAPPRPPIVSMVTGIKSYDDHNARELLHQWVDHPQRLWDVVYTMLAEGVETVIHVGPEPNLIPATFKRLSDNVAEQVSGRSLGSLGLRAVSRLAGRQWLKALLPSRTALLRAPKIEHVILEDWLLAAEVKE